MQVKYYLSAAIFLNTLFYIHITAHKTECSRQSDCRVDRYTSTCSICVNDGDGTQGHCIYILNDTYVPTPACERFTNENCPLNCNDRGECLTTHLLRIEYYVPYCSCEQGYYGENCQYKNTHKIAQLVYLKFKFTDMIQVCESTTLEFTFYLLTSEWPSRIYEVYVKIGDEGFIRIPKYMLRGILTKGVKYHDYLTLKHVFPYKADASVYRLGDKYIGYNTYVYMYICIHKEVVFQKTWDIFVKYEGLKCFPKITIAGCASKPTAPAEFTRSTRIAIHFDVHYITDASHISMASYDESTSCKVSERIYWKICKIESEVSSDPPIDEQYETGRSITLDPFKLTIGLYQVYIEVTNTGLDKLVINSALCFFNITCVPLVAKIEGGNERLVSPHLGLLLIAEKSHDPNMSPNDQNHVFIEWSCVNLNSSRKHEKMCDPKRFMVWQQYYISQDLLTPGEEYNFKLKVWTDKYDENPDCSKRLSPQYANVTVKIASWNETQFGNIMIECLVNCESKVAPNNILYLKARQPLSIIDTSNTIYNWTYHERGGAPIDTDAIRVPELRPYILIVKEDTLKLATQYTILVRIENTAWYAKYDFETVDMDFDVNCTVVPESGKKGETMFNITCSVEKNPSGYFLTYEFYDKSDAEKDDGFIFSGRMLGTSKSGQLLDVHLTRGNILIYILIEYGLYLNKNLTVELEEWEIGDDILTKLYQNVTDRARFGSIPSTLGALSFIPDIIPPNMEQRKDDIFNTLIGFITRLSLTNLGDMRMSLSSMINILVSLNKPNQLQLKPYYIAATFQNIKQQAEIFSQKVLSGEMHNMSPREVKQVSIGILNCLQVGLLCKDKRTENIQEKELDFSVERQLRMASLHAEGIVDLVTNTLSYIQAPGQPVARISSKDDRFVAWVMENDEITSIVDLLSKENDIPLLFSNETFNKINSGLSKHEEIALQVVSMEDNIYWWSQPNVQSRLVSVSINRHFKKGHLYPIRYIDTPITILVDSYNTSTPTTIHGNTLMPDPNSDPLTLDLGVRIHRFEPALRSQTTFRFLFPPTNTSLRVFVTDQFRPDYTIMMKAAITITRNYTTYDVPYYNYNEPYFLYMGVVPGQEVAVNKSVEYAFEVSTTLCEIWATAEWSSTGCQISRVENSTKVHCECTHFSIFTAAFPVPANRIDPYKDTILFLTVLENPYVVIFVMVILAIYLLLCLFLCRSDRKTRVKRNIILLEDNMPSDNVPYLVVVYTSPRINAGTSAHVGIKIHGKDAQSRSHILSCKSHSILRRNNDDWFLIYCPEPLGDVEALHVWHDNSGSNPEWLCEKIVVYDLSQNTETLFIVDEWLALNKNEFPEAYVLSAAIEDLKNVKSFFLDNLVLGLREKHLLLSCLLSHPRSELTRLQRLSIFMCSLMVAMLCSIMFYLPTGQRRYVDTYTYSINLRQLYVGLQTLIISVSVSYIVLSLFQKSYKITYVRNKTTLRLRSLSNKKSDIYTYDDHIQAKTGDSCYRSFVRIVTRTIKSNILEPITLPNSQSLVEVQRFWLILSWTVSIVIICLCSYLVMLYGLKLGMVNSKEWLSSLLIATGGDILIYTPAKIVVMSSLLATALLRMYDLSLHRVDVKDLLHIKITNDIEDINKILQQRRQSMYKPLQQKQKDEMLHSEKRRRKRWKCLDYIITVLTLMTFNNLIYQMFLMHFYTTSHVVHMMTRTKQEVVETIKYDEILNVYSLQKYLQYTFVNCLYDLRWYNDRLIDRDENNTQSGYWASDFTHRMLGIPVIRQLRVTPKRCESVIIKHGICIPDWSYSSQDKDDYGKRWQPATWSDVSTSKSPWQYTELTSISWLNRYRLTSPSGVTYVTGGYKEQLSSTRKGTEVMLAELNEDSWLDEQTRAVFVEFSMYNVNENVFVQVTMMVEYLKSGIALPIAQASAFKTGFFPSLLNLLFVVLIIYFLIRCILIIDREGIAQFFSYCDNILKTVIVVLGFLSVILFTVHYRVSTEYSESFHRRGLDNYFDFDSLVHYYLLLRVVLSLLQCFVILHAFSLVMTWKSLVKHLHTVTLSLKWIIWLAIACVTFIYVFMALNNIFQMSTEYNVINVILARNSLECIQLNCFQCLHVQMFVIAKVVAITVIMWCFVINFIVFVKVVKK